jgi:hypothetical protein
MCKVYQIGDDGTAFEGTMVCNVSERRFHDGRIYYVLQQLLRIRTINDSFQVKGKITEDRDKLNKKVRSLNL